FSTLGAWTMLSRGKLAETLGELGDGGPFPDDVLAKARTLFARAIETPGGLKIQTIHSFCAAVLRRFPLEAGVSPDFREMDDRLAALLKSEVVEALAEAGDEGFAAMAREQQSDDLSSWLAEVIAHRERLQIPVSREDIRAAFDLPGDFDPVEHAKTLLSDENMALLERLARALSTSGKRDKDKSRELLAIDFSARGLAEIEALESVCLKKSGEPTGTYFPSVSARKSLVAADAPSYDALSEALADFKEMRRRARAVERTGALHSFAASFLPAYEARKAQGGWLDFDDLIQRTRSLLSRSQTAPWVLYKLDGGIDHILVDEAQDTSPAQWDVIRTLANEFLAGEGAQEDKDRTVFVVGDKKQSIYSFQGADPRAFDATRAHFASMLTEAPEPLQDRSLDFSFRSAPALLSVVDKVFEDGPEIGLGQMSHHRAFKDTLPGRVDLLDPWAQEKPEEGEWYEALDRITPKDHRRRLAEDIAERIDAMIGKARIPVIDKDGRRDKIVEPRDILILVQRRSDIFNEIIRVCKARGIPMAGADQLQVAQELAVRDITALLSFLATPEDDLSLACALKSPLLGWEEPALFDLAHYRTQSYLWPALRDRKADFPETVALLQDMLAKADFLRPYELIERLLTEHGGRRAIHARLGPEADDAIDALLAQAMAYEQSETPSLTGFLTWLTADDFKIKRAIDRSANVVRVMTVHGAKGLEAPIVIMPDTALRRAPNSSDIAVLNDLPIWRTKQDDAPKIAQPVREREIALRIEERQRLLYVALTRAECWLIIGAAGEIEGKSNKGWYAQIRDALETFETKPIPGGTRYEPLPWPLDASDESPRVEPRETQLNLPKPPVRPRPLPPLAPSDLGGAKTLPGSQEDETALAKGRAIHRLLEVLPGRDPAIWQAIAERICAREGVETAPSLATAGEVINAPHLAEIFGAGTLAEVPFTAELEDLGGRRVRGSIDRLILRGESVLAVDFKSNALEPASASDVPEGLLRQMGAYGAALEEIYPDKRIETALLWTASKRLMPLEHQVVKAALQRSVMLDARGSAS
ncbi:MAG: double-strand break repair helicase AddA, partial [Pseudomonadota bacterium]